VKPHAHPSQELLTYEFTSRKPTEAVAELQWEELAVPFTIQVPNADDLYISRLNQELTSVPGFFWQAISAPRDSVSTRTRTWSRG